MYDMQLKNTKHYILYKSI